MSMPEPVRSEIEVFSLRHDPVAEAAAAAAGKTRERMIIRTDLYAAILHENRLLSQKNVTESPAKVITALALLIFGAGVAHYFYLTSQAQKLRPQAQELVAKADFTQRELQNAKQRVAEMRENVARRTALMRFAETRVNWAPMLEAVLAATPAQIELTSIRAMSGNLNKASILVSGRTATRNSRLDCDKYRLLLLEALNEAGLKSAESKFKRLEEVDPGGKTVGNAFLVTEFTIELTWGIENGR